MKSEIKKGCIAQSTEEEPKYRVFFSDSIETLVNEELLGYANNAQEAFAIIKECTKPNKYWRFLMGEDATFIDYGSWSRFAVIIPSISIQEINRAE